MEDWFCDMMCSAFRNEALEAPDLTRGLRPVEIALLRAAEPEGSLFAAKLLVACGALPVAGARPVVLGVRCMPAAGRLLYGALLDEVVKLRPFCRSLISAVSDAAAAAGVPPPPVVLVLGALRAR